MPESEAFWDVKIWWTEGERKRWEAGCQVFMEHASTAQEALAVCLEWRNLKGKILDGFNVARVTDAGEWYR